MDIVLPLYNDLLSSNYVLPHTLRACYEAFREDEFRRVCRDTSTDDQQRLRKALKVFANDVQIASFGEVFSLLDDDAYGDMPPGQVIELPEAQPRLIARFDHALELQSLVIDEAKRLGRVCGEIDLSRDLLHTLGSIASVGTSDFHDLPTPDAVLRYVAASCSPRVSDYLWRTPILMEERQVRRFVFPNMVPIRVDQIAELGRQHGTPFSTEDFSCFSDEEIKLIGRDHRAFALLPTCKHYAICELCQERVSQFARRWMAQAITPPEEYADLPIFRRRPH